ncbi:MAG TPA: serine hydrolase [Bacillales bacterium]|nr:serine hydrolase [Bacillales bacterium]
MNRHFYQKYVASALAIIMFFSLFVGFNKAEAEAPLNINAAGAILIDGESGKVLYEKNADSLLGIASMSKMMTEYILFDSIKNGRVKWNQEYTVNSFVSDLSHKTELSNVPLRSDGKYTIKELYNQMAIYSSNSATIAIAETIAGSEANFVKMMNDEAKKLGLQNYKFVNSTGLNNRDYQGQEPTGGSDDENAMSTRSVATLAFHLINDFPEVLETTSITKSKSVDGVNMPNWNWMLPGLVYEYQGMDGLKTGTTDFAGYCFTGTAMRDGKRFITVVQNAIGANGKGSYEARFGETRKMMDYAFSNFTKEEIIPKDYQIKGHKTIPVIKGKEKQVEITTNRAIDMVVLSGEKKNYQPVLVLGKSKLTKNGELEAPIKKGEKIGYLTIKPKNGEKVTFLTAEGQKKLQADVVAAKTVEKSNWFVLMMRGIGGFFGDLFGGISSAVKGWF